MSIAWVSQGTVGTGSTSVTPGLPASLATGDGVLIQVVSKPDTATINTPTGWTLVASVAGGGGTTGNGVGPTRQAWFFREKDATWSTMPAISITSGNASASIASRWTKAAGTTWSIAAATAAFGTAAATVNISQVMGSDPGFIAGDHCAVGLSLMDEAPTWDGISGKITIPGWSQFTLSERSEAVETTTGNDVGGWYGTLSGFLPAGGPSSGAPTVAHTASIATRGTIVVVRLREVVPVVEPFQFKGGYLTQPSGGAQAVTGSITVAAGDLVIGLVKWDTAAPITILQIESDGIDWWRLAGPTVDAVGISTQLFWSKVENLGVSVTVDFSGGYAQDIDLSLLAYTPPAGQELRAIHAANSGITNTTVSGPSVTTTSTPGVVVGFTVSNDGTTPGAGSGYTARHSVIGHGAIDAQAPSVATYTPTYTYNAGLNHHSRTIAIEVGSPGASPSARLRRPVISNPAHSHSHTW